MFIVGAVMYEPPHAFFLHNRTEIRVEYVTTTFSSVGIIFLNVRKRAELPSNYIFTYIKALL